MRYAQIRELDISNGEGVGISLFVQGCHFHCRNCFNPETWDFNRGKEWTAEIRDRFIKLADKDYIKRITILGGEPLCDENVNEVALLIRMLKYNYPDKSIWVYTGYKYEDIKRTISNMIDANRLNILIQTDVLVDGQYMDELKDYRYSWAGSTNQRVIDVQQSLKENKVVLYKSE